MYKLLIKKLECVDLKNLEIFLDKNDVFATLQWSGATYKTDVKREAGKTAIFENEDMVLNLEKELSGDTSINAMLNVQVWNHNKLRPHDLIGETEIDISSILESPNIEKTFSIDLLSKKQACCGKVVLQLLIETKSGNTFNNETFRD